MAGQTMVRISFDRSEETLRWSFVPHLSAALGRKGIFVSTNMHDESVASVLVFSKNYLSSKELLDEVFKTNQRRHDKGHVVTTVFYGVSRSNVQELKGFGKTLFEHGASDQVTQWRNALTEISNLLGYEASNCQSEYEVVEKIARDVYEKIFPKQRIGIYSRMLAEVENFLCKQPWGVKRIGICGMPGVGKTVLAEAIFDQMSGDYEVTCFVHNFHVAYHERGLYGLLQEQIKNLSNKTLQQRVLVVLDDVRNHLDAESFLAELVLFSRGSLIIVTTRDEQVLSQCRVNQTYKVEGLNMEEALRLFSWCASGRVVTEINLLPEHSKKVIEHENGNPLALRLYAEEMSSHKELNQKEILFLMQTPAHQIMEVVKSSYYALNDNEKNILVYIAYFFIGANVEYVSKLLQDLGFFPEIGIDRLVENSLVNISENILEMHSMIEAVVREIGRCHKLKTSEDHKISFKCVLGTEDIEAISLDASNLNSDVKLSSLAYMYNLRFLKIYYSDPENNRKALESLPDGLRLLHWEYYPLQTLPQDFNTSNLVELNMPYSQLQRLWGGTKNLKMLKRINLRHSEKLYEAEELSGALNLEQIDLSGCKNLQSFPAIHQLQKLQVVDLSGCTQIKRYPEFPSNVTLKFQGITIKNFLSPVTFTIKSLLELFDNTSEPHIFDVWRLRSFWCSQERITNPGMVEPPPTLAMILQKALKTTPSFQFKYPNLRID
ncbi:PREDICTED: probable WRKY transcription factor 16 [Camelina sativa]|uniref:Probable WRKY transcription factor 16 n=1 Tax=Camelina sativa TaxID=90675 RepID=A0ABM0X6W9_CAMSA|nr:PREDICTED: probable WRKY transcription factor 16 [Camelina sativa]